MAYQALYRTYRPAQFSEVVGQDHITKVLTGQISLSKISHAYLFAGPRGTGKTSLAKIFAGAVNCIGRESFEPCGECESCINGSVDIIEIDAASNNGVDNVREIRDRVNLLPAVCAYKVYIIDEAHMLSKGAFNALLKTLEEPPPHIIFILATTEPHKLPPTIRSRCQRFDFRRIPVDIISSLLEKVADNEGIEYEKNALPMIARAAEGGMRDALSILDQCLAFGAVSADAVAGALGGTDIAQVTKLAGYISSYQERDALITLRTIIDSGADTRALINDLADVFRRMMWISSGAETQSFEELKEFSDRYGKRACVRALDILIQKEYEMRQNLRADIVLETAVMALMAPQDDKSSGSAERIERLEHKLRELEENGIKAPPAAKRQTSATEKQPVPQKEAKEQAPAVAPEKKPENKNEKPDESSQYWQALLESLRQEEYYVFTHAKMALETKINGNVLEVVFDSDDVVSADLLKKEAASKAILDRIKQHNSNVEGISVEIKAKPKDDGDEKIIEMFGADIERI